MKKKIWFIIIPIVLVVIIAVAIIVGLLLKKKNKEDENSSTGSKWGDAYYTYLKENHLFKDDYLYISYDKEIEKIKNELGKNLDEKTGLYKALDNINKNYKEII